MRVFGSRRRVSTRGRISGTLPTEMVPPMWGRGWFLATPRTIQFRTKAGARHALGTWAAISTYQVSRAAITLWIPRGPYFVTVEIARVEGDESSRVLEMLIANGVRESRPDSLDGQTRDSAEASLETA
jgi:hypothetical protein